MTDVLFGAARMLVGFQVGAHCGSSGGEDEGAVHAQIHGTARKLPYPENGGNCCGVTFLGWGVSGCGFDKMSGLENEVGGSRAEQTGGV